MFDQKRCDHRKGAFSIGAVVVASLILSISPALGNGKKKRSAQKQDVKVDFRAAFSCRTCHPPTVDQHELSGHFDSFHNPVFQSAYYDSYVPRLHKSATPVQGRLACLSCHAPMAYLSSGYHVAQAKSEEDPYGKPCKNCHLASDGSHDRLFENPAAQESAIPEESRPLWPVGNKRELAGAGVSCDFCHSITKLRGKTQGNAGYVCAPGETMYGPFVTDNYHQAYSELHTKSEFCAICHNAVNRHGVPVRATFSEWAGTSLAANGIQCQDCHMTPTGYLVDGKPAHESGRAAFMRFGTISERERLHAHRFSGGDVTTQLEGALSLEFVIDEAPLQPGREATLKLVVRNDRTGHDFPTGSVELRSLWIEVGGTLGESTLSAVASSDAGAFGVAGGTEGDHVFFGPEMTPGARVYRAVFVDAHGDVTLSIADATEVAFDNRLAAGEMREELFRLAIPEQARGELQVNARAYLVRYPRALTDRLGRKTAALLPVASDSTTLRITGG